MQLSKTVKSLMLVVPLFTLVACPSTDNMGSENGTDGNYGVNGMNGSSSWFNQSGDIQFQLQQLQQHNTIYFGFDKYDVTAQYADILDGHAMFLRANPGYKVVIEGHADERGTPEYNIALGERRATAAMMYLQSKGVPAEQMSIVSYGKEKPAVLGHDESAYSQNRRAVLVY